MSIFFTSFDLGLLFDRKKKRDKVQQKKNTSHLPRPRRREEQRLPLRRDRPHDPLDLRLEAHVEHAVRLVQDEVRDLVQPDHAALEEVVEAPRGRDDELDAEAEVAELRALGGAAWGGGEEEEFSMILGGREGWKGGRRRRKKVSFLFFAFCFDASPPRSSREKKNSRRLLSIDAP